jgi:hypothetical protein
VSSSHKSEINPASVHRRLKEMVGGGRAHDMVNVLPQTLRCVIDNELWADLKRADGQPFGSLYDFLVAWWPHGCGVGQDDASLNYAQLMELCRGWPSILDALAKNAPKGTPGRPKNSGRDNGSRTAPIMSRGKSAAHKTATLQARLAQEHPAVWAAFIAGEYRSVRAAAEAAGLVARTNDPLARLKANWNKATPAARRKFLAYLNDTLTPAERRFL